MTQIHGELTERPNAPGYPRAIVQATWNPVHDSVTSPLTGST